MSVNKVILIGNLGQAPRVSRLQGGGTVVNLSVATSERWTDKRTGEKREATQWHSVVIWNEALAGVAEKYLSKGSKVYVEGRLETRKWQDQSGQDRYTTEVVLRQFGSALVLLDGRGGDGGDARSAPEEKGGAKRKPGGIDSSAPADPPSRGLGDLDDEIPF